jgi:Fur family transcriptional regulator, peroxide stress response regulator
MKELRPGWSRVTSNSVNGRDRVVGKPAGGTRTEMESLPLDQVRLRAIVETAGLRCTPQRLAVYQHLCNSAEHPSAEIVFHAVRAQIPKISLATVYKALEALVAVGVATKLSAGLGVTRARYDARRDEHYHFRCLRSGTVHDLPTQFDPDLIAKLDPSLQDDLSRHGFRVTGYRLELVGYRERSLPDTLESRPEEGKDVADSMQVARSPSRGADIA